MPYAERIQYADFTRRSLHFLNHHSIAQVLQEFCPPSFYCAQPNTPAEMRQFARVQMYSHVVTLANCLRQPNVMNVNLMDDAEASAQEPGRDALLVHVVGATPAVLAALTPEYTWLLMRFIPARYRRIDLFLISPAMPAERNGRVEVQQFGAERCVRVLTESVRYEHLTSGCVDTEWNGQPDLCIVFNCGLADQLFAQV